MNVDREDRVMRFGRVVTTGRGRRGRGFALILVVALLGFLVLAVFALSVLVRVEGQVTTTGAQQEQARAHAQLALRLALGELQRHAGSDDCVTAMAGVTGVPAGSTRTTRHWCGVWQGDGSFAAWLVSGAPDHATAALAAGQPGVTLVGAGSVGASYSDSEHVIAGLLPIAVPEPDAAPGAERVVGGYAWLVLDEGAKLSAYSPPELLGVGGVRPVLAQTSPTSAQGRLRAALEAGASRLDDVSSYEQLCWLPGSADPLTASTLQDNFHHATLTALSVGDDGWRASRINLNTTSAHVWRGILATYNTIPGVDRIEDAEVLTRGAAIAADLADCGSGKVARAPFASVAAFGASTLLSARLPPAVTPAEFIAAIGPMLGVRSDTFRLRGYGEARNPARAGVVEASAVCEALVQRTLEPAGGTLGRRFVITRFRWLAPDDI